MIPAFVSDSGLSRTGNAAATFGAIAVAVAIYAGLVLALRIVSRDDVMLMPKGEKIAKYLHYVIKIEKKLLLQHRQQSCIMLTMEIMGNYLSN